jgi:hypothetical protein
MRSSKNRSRSKGNRNRSVGNIVNRVFDSSGPEGKVRGTPQQIIDKYNQLARDAQLGNDRVAAENFQQHAEHYLRLLGEAQREQEARREQQQGGNQQGGNQQGGNQQGGTQQGGGQQSDGQRGGDQQGRGGPDDGQKRQDGDEGRSFDAVMDPSDQSESTLVETPESAPKPRRARSRRSKKTDAGDDGPSTDGGGDSSQEAAE